MILIEKTLKDADGVCEVARKFTGFGEYAFIYDLIGSEGYEEDEQDIPLCVINNDGNGFEIVFHPYEEKLRNILKLEYHEADYLKKLLSFIEKTNRDISQEPEVPCKTHPDAPHGFDRNASHSADRYVCECEGWEPDLAMVGEVGVWGDKREWVGLTDNEIGEWWWAIAGEWPKDSYAVDDNFIVDESCIVDFARAIEAKLKEKNHE